MLFQTHLVRIILGYLAATLVALLAGISLPWVSPRPGASALDLFSADFLALLPIYWLIIAAFAAIPALIAVVLAETIKLRSLLVHILIGAFVGLLISGQLARISPWLSPFDVPVQDTFGSAIMVIAGALGALAYWRIAGRYAGAWREA